MKFLPALLGVVSALLTSCDRDLADITGLDDGKGLGWLDDLDQAFLVAAETDRPLLVVFR